MASGTPVTGFVHPLERLSDRRLALEMATASFVVLMEELVLIRWLPGQVRVLAYYPNLVLLATFLGLGLGCLLAWRRPWRPAWPWLSLATVAAAGALGGVVFTQKGVSEHLFLLYHDLPRSAPVVAGVWPPILLFFVMTTLAFVPLGQLVAERLDEFRRRGRPLRGYSWDLAGSLAGVVVFAGLGMAGTPPIVWFLGFLVPAALFVRRSRRAAAGYAVAVVATLVVVRHVDTAERYSPYYALSVVPGRSETAYEIRANGSLHQVALPLDGTATGRYARRVFSGYTVPYRLLGRPPGRVLVLGAGTGNDVAVALAMGAEHVDAVEIDPAIIELGREIHPSRPYDSPRVRVINADARAFLNSSGERYDVVVLGTLDSMTRLSAMSSVRLDNFVYTRDGLRAIRPHLTDRGVLFMFFMVETDYIDERLAGLAAEACGEVPLTEREHYNLFSRIYMCGPGLAHLEGAERRAAVGDYLAGIRTRVELPSDDWPYLYLARRGIGPFYLWLALAFAVVAVAGVAAASPAMRRGLGGRGAADWPMFWFGVGFLLIETRAVTEMNLVWSATWLTSAVVFASILATVLAATLLASARPVSYQLSTAGAMLALVATWATPTSALATVDWGVKLALSTAFVGLPAFFASLCFVALFRQRPESANAFGWNLLGAVTGGLLELGAMATGFKALHLVALLAYLMAFAAWTRARRSSAARAFGSTATPWR